jgi:hypothetical protein
MPRRTTRKGRGSALDLLTADQDAELLFGPTSATWPAFGSPWAAEVAWNRHRDEYLAGRRSGGTRPAAFWCFDVHDRRANESEDAYLARTGQLTDDEVAEFLAWAAQGDLRCRKIAKLIHYRKEDP